MGFVKGGSNGTPPNQQQYVRRQGWEEWDEPDTPWVTAAYPGTCSNCWWEFPAGVLIRADGEGGWMAECCGE